METNESPNDAHVSRGFPEHDRSSKSEKLEKLETDILCEKTRKNTHRYARGALARGPRDTSRAEPSPTPSESASFLKRNSYLSFPESLPIWETMDLLCPEEEPRARRFSKGALKDTSSRDSSTTHSTNVSFHTHTHTQGNNAVPPRRARTARARRRWWLGPARLESDRTLRSASRRLVSRGE